jgi:hypothetical protein
MADNIYKAIHLLREKILTPILYMIEYSDRINFICFCDKNIKMEELYNTSSELTNILGIPAEIMDIREFSEADRLDILKNAKLVYSEDPIIEQIFIASMAEDYRNSVMEKLSMIDRYKQTGSYYLQ